MIDMHSILMYLMDWVYFNGEMTWETTPFPTLNPEILWNQMIDFLGFMDYFPC